MTETAVRTPVEILELTRQIFASTHWETGYMFSAKWDETSETYNKAAFCSVGGLRYAALAPMEHALDQVWMVQHGEGLAEDGFAPGDNQDLAARYLEAIEALAEVVVPGWFDVYRSDWEDAHENTFFRINDVEDAIVNWNDRSAERGASKGAYRDEVVMPGFDKAITLLKSREESK